MQAYIPSTRFLLKMLGLHGSSETWCDSHPLTWLARATRSPPDDLLYVLNCSEVPDSQRSRYQDVSKGCLLYEAAYWFVFLPSLIWKLSRSKKHRLFKGGLATILSIDQSEASESGGGRWREFRIPCHFLPENWENNAIKLVVLLCFILVETPWTSWIYETSCNLHPTCSASGSDQVIHLIRKYVHHMDTVTKTRLVDALQRQHDFYVNRLQQELVVELLESTTGDELRMMLARQLPIWDVFHMARSSHSLQSRGAATQNDWPPIELFLVGSLAFSNFWCSQVRMKDILDEGGDFYNLHKLVFHDLDPEMCFGCKRHGQNMCFLFRSCPAPFMMFPYMCSFFPNS